MTSRFRAAAAAVALAAVSAVVLLPNSREPDNLGAAVGRSPRQVYPDSVLIRTDVCPFECCVYGEWTATSPIAVGSREGLERDTVFVIRPAETFAALTGNVHVTGIQRVVVMRPVSGLQALATDHDFAVGDTLLVLDYIGEGLFNVWLDGTVYRVEQFWSEAPWDPGAGAAGYSVGEYASEWWVQARNADGLVGWFRAGSTDTPDGADACA